MCHQSGRRIPRIHQHGAEGDLPPVNRIKHFSDVIEFGFAVAVGVENPVINHPKTIRRGIVINAGDDSDATNYAAGIARILPTDTGNIVPIGFIGNRVVENNIAVSGGNQSLTRLFPNQTRFEFLVFQIAVNAVMVEIINVVSEIRASIINLAAQ